MSRVTLLSLIFFICSALAYALLEWQAVDKIIQKDTAQELTPDFIAENLQSKSYNEQGNIAYIINADRMEHYSKLSITHFEAPIYTLHPSNQEAWVISAKEGTLYNNTRVKLAKNVRIYSTTSNSLIREVQGKSLEIDLTNNIISAEQAILIKGIDFTMQGAGLIIDLNTNQMSLTDHVQTTYEKTSN